MGCAIRPQNIGNNFMCCQFDRERPPSTNRPFESAGWWLMGRSKCGTLTHLDPRVKRSRTPAHTTEHKWKYCGERIATGYHNRPFGPALLGRGRSRQFVCFNRPTLEAGIIALSTKAKDDSERNRYPKKPGMHLDMHFPLSTEPSD